MNSAAPHGQGRGPRAAIVVTGSELVRGDRSDRNGPFLARSLVALGLTPSRITIVGDAPTELEQAFAVGLEADLCVVSGGLGPTHDDRTVELLARAAGLPLDVDPALEEEIERVSRAVADRLGRPYADFSVGVTKQATLPAGAESLGLAGTAPGFVVLCGSSVVVVLPGPPSELQRLWPLALAHPLVAAVVARANPPDRRVLRFFGASESAVARALADVGGDGEGVEATICARDFEIHVDLFVEPGGAKRADTVAGGLRERLARYLFSEDERPIAELVLARCRALGLTLGTAESCTGGLVAERLTSIPGSSDVFLGSIVAYADAVKERELGVPRETLETHGAVCAETAQAMARGIRERLGVDCGIAVTGIAGPDGGTDEKPVGLVYVHVCTPGEEGALDFDYPGDRESIRRRAAVAALHLTRRLLTQSRDTHA
jgi:competence/damage-inducible protein CinA-like protein